MTVHTLEIGGARIRTLVDVDPYPVSLAMVFPDASEARVAPHRSWLEPLHLRGPDLLLVIQSMLLEIDGRIILIDTCIGEHKSRPARQIFHNRTDTGFLARLAAMGVKPEQVDTVLCTHLHIDHVGWNTQLRDGRWVPTFPRARYLLGRKELAHWEAQQPRADVNHGSFVDSVLPIVEAGLVDLVDDGHELLPGLVLRPLPGHTPGQMGLWLERGNTRALFCGDALHSPLQLACPDLSAAFDSDRAEARITRLAMLESVAASGSILVPAHFRGGCGCRIASDGGTGFRFA